MSVLDFALNGVDFPVTVPEIESEIELHMTVSENKLTPCD